MPFPHMSPGSFFGAIDTDRYAKYDAITRRYVSGVDNEALRIARDFTDAVMMLMPNGDVPLTALLSMCKKSQCHSPHIEWESKMWQRKSGPVDAVYSDAMMTTLYAGGGVAGTVLYLRVDASVSQFFREGNQVLLRMAPNPAGATADIQAGDYRVDVTARVLRVTGNSTNSIISVQLLEADDNAPDETPVGPVAHDLRNCNWIRCLGSVNPEMSGLPSSINLVPAEYGNFTQIFIDAAAISRTAHQTQLINASDGGWLGRKMELIQDHALGLEQSMMYSVRTKTVGQNGRPMRTMEGLIPFIKANGHTANFEYEVDPIVAGKTWYEGWYSWLMVLTERLFAYGSSTERMGFIGSRALINLNDALLHMPSNMFTLTTATKAYGFKVVEFVTPSGTIYFKTHPLMSRDPVDSNACVIFDPADIEYVWLQDTMQVGPDTIKEHKGSDFIDGLREGLLTEATLRYFNPIKCLYATGFGRDNVM